MLLMVLQPLLAFTIFKFPQMIVELAMLALLSAGVFSSRLKVDELLLLLIFAFSQLLSFLFNDLSEFLVGAKQFGLGIFALIYFRKNSIPLGPYVLNVVFIVNLLVTLLQYFEVSAVKMSYRQILGVFAEFEETKPLGLFLNYHFSSFFSAVYLIYLTSVRSAFFLDYVYLSVAGTGTSLVSYIMQKIYYFCIRRRILRDLSLSTLIIAFIASVIVGVELVKAYFINIDYSAANIGGTGESALVVVSQLSSPEFYKSFLSFIPFDPTNLVVIGEYNNFILAHHGGNEVQYLQTVLQGGLPVAILYFYMILKSSRLYRVFLLFSMLHYSFILMPLMIYMYSRDSRHKS